MKRASISFLRYKNSIPETLKEIENTSAEFIHVDVMDGKFVDNFNLSFEDANKYLSSTTKPMDVHLMVEDPKDYIELYKNFNTDRITIHYEIKHDIKELIDLIHSYNIKAGIAINPKTRVGEMKEYLPYIEQVIIMGVNPGAGGQQMIPACVDKIQILKELREKNNYNFDISIDGGVNAETLPLLNDLDIVIAGSYVSLSDNFEERIKTMR